MHLCTFKQIIFSRMPSTDGNFHYTELSNWDSVKLKSLCIVVFYAGLATRERVEGHFYCQLVPNICKVQKESLLKWYKVMLLVYYGIICTCTLYSQNYLGTWPTHLYVVPTQPVAIKYTESTQMSFYYNFPPMRISLYTKQSPLFAKVVFFKTCLAINR